MEPPDPRTAPDRLRRLPSWLLNQAALAANRAVAAGFAEAGTRRYHYALLAALDEVGPTSQADLSRRTTIDRSDMVAAVSDLVGQGNVERAPDPDDRRRNVVSLTTAGRRRLRQLDRVVTEAQETFLAPLPPPDRDRLVALLIRLVDGNAGPPTR